MARPPETPTLGVDRVKFWLQSDQQNDAILMEEPTAATCEKLENNTLAKHLMVSYTLLKGNPCRQQISNKI
jgi:hypothetical protein